MAKPTGATEYSQAGFDVENATEDSPARGYINIVIPKQSTTFSQDYRVKRQFIKLSPIVDYVTSGDLTIEVYSGDSFVANWTNITSGNGYASEIEDEREPDTTLFSRFVSTDCDVEYVRLEVRAWTNTNINSAKIIGFWVRTDTGPFVTGLGFHNRNTQTAANRLYKPNRAITAYHMRRLVAGSINALNLSSTMEQMVPLYGIVPP